MPDTKISQLTDGASIGSADTLVAVRGGNNVKIPANRLANGTWIIGRNAANTGDVNLFRTTTGGQGYDWIDVGAQLQHNEDGSGFGSSSSHIKLRQVKTLTSPGLWNTVDMYNSYRGTKSIADRMVGINVSVYDDNAVANRAITGMSRSGTTITVTATAHGFVNGEYIAIYGSTNSFNVNPNDNSYAISNVTANTFDITVAGLSSGTYTSGGTATNRPMMYGIAASVVPRVDRGALAGNIGNADDTAVYVGYNGGTAKSTDCFYAAANPAIVGSAFNCMYSADANADYHFYSGHNVLNAGFWLHGTYTGPGIDFNACTINSYGIDFNNANFGGGAASIRLKNSWPIVGRNAANGADINLLSVQSDDSIWIAPGGQNVVFGAAVPSGANPYYMFGGYKTGVGGKTGTLRVDAAGNFNITAPSGQLLGLSGDTGIHVNWPSAGDIFFFAGSSGSTTNRSLFVYGWDGSAQKIGTLKIGTNGHFQIAGSSGTVEAVASDIKLDNLKWLKARNAANNADVNLIRLNASDQLEFGSAATPILATGTGKTVDNVITHLQTLGLARQS